MTGILTITILSILCDLPWQNHAYCADDWFWVKATIQPLNYCSCWFQVSDPCSHGDMSKNTLRLPVLKLCKKRNETLAITLSYLLVRKEIAPGVGELMIMSISWLQFNLHAKAEVTHSVKLHNGKYKLDAAGSERSKPPLLVIIIIIMTHHYNYSNCREIPYNVKCHISAIYCPISCNSR